IGFVLGAMLFIGRMSRNVAIDAGPLPADDVADSQGDARTAYDPGEENDEATVVYRLSGAFFFGTASTVGAMLDRIADRRRSFILDVSGVPVLDSTAANIVAGAARKAEKSG